jgi:hypothetical protein
MNDNCYIWDFKVLDNNDEIKIGNICKNVNDLIVCITGKKGTEDDANLIIDGVWLGNYDAAKNIKFVIENNIKYIINATYQSLIPFSFVDYKLLPMSDSDICEENFLSKIREGAAFINKAMLDNIPILVHCKRGHHRSASIVAYYLMVYKNMSLIDALTLIKNKRPTAFRRMACTLKTLIICEHNSCYQKKLSDSSHS